MKVEIKQDVMLKNDLTKYSENKTTDMKVYKKGTIIDNVDSKYEARFKKYPEHIEILSKVKKDETTNTEVKEVPKEKSISDMTKKQLVAYAKENGIKFNKKMSVEEIKQLFISLEEGKSEEDEKDEE